MFLVRLYTYENKIKGKEHNMENALQQNQNADIIEVYNHDTQNEHLAPCPFCGSAPVWFLKGNEFTPSRTVVIRCPHCNVRMEIGGRILSSSELAERLMKKWDTRNNK